MKKTVAFFTALLVFSFGLQSPTFGENYNHGYCSECDHDVCPSQCPCPPDPAECQGYCEPCAPVCAPACQDPCDPCAPVCGTSCGISCCAIGIGVAAVAAAAAIIISSGNGSSGHS